MELAYYAELSLFLVVLLTGICDPMEVYFSIT